MTDQPVTNVVEIINCKLKEYSTQGCHSCWYAPCGKRGCDNLAGYFISGSNVSVKVIDCKCDMIDKQ